MKKKKATLGIVIGIVAAAIVAIAMFLVINMIKDRSADTDDVGEIYYYQTPAEHIAEENGISYADNEILVVANDGVSKKDIEQLAEQYGAEVVGYIEATGDYQWKLSDSLIRAELDELVSEIGAEPSVVSASLNLFFPNENNSASTKEIDSGKKWRGDLKNATDMKGKSWGVEAINAPEAWRLMNDQRIQIQPVRVGVIDNGFDESHEDLPFNEVFYNKPYMDASDKDQKELGGHGTHVAGTFAANGTNQDGICGVYPYSEEGGLYAASWENGNRQYSENKQSLISQEVCFAELILRNVRVINCSYGSADYYGATAMYYINVLNDREKTDLIYDELVNAGSYFGGFLKRFLDKGYDFVVVKSAGNSSNKTIKIKINGQEIDYQTGDVPAIYNGFMETVSESEYPDVYSRIIVVGAIDKEYNRLSFSNSGTFSEKTERVDVYAPGWDIYSTVPVNKYENGKKWSGTSMAAPHVAGIAASTWSINNNLSGAQIKAIIRNATNMEHTNLPIVDMASAVRVSFLTRKYNEDVAEMPSGNGMVMGFVVDAEDYTVTENGIEKGAIEAAEIVVKNADTNERVEPTVKTDSNGHFEIILPAGNYKLTVYAEGYNAYEWSETVKVEDGQVNYLSDWIKIDKTPKALAPESAVEIYLNNKEIWMAYPEYFPMNGYSYGFLDLDFDGTLELVRNICDGSGRYSDNTYFKIDMTDYSVYMLKCASNEDDEVVGDGYDYSLNDEYPKLLKRKTDGSFTYYCMDFLRITTGDYISYYGTLNLTDDMIVSDTLFAEHHQEAGLYNSLTSVDEYFHYINNNETEISKSMFNEEMAAYFKEMEDVGLIWSLIPGKDLETAVYSKQRELMVEAYKKFGYKGFSFDRLDLIEPKLNNSYSEDLYSLLTNSVWINDIQSHNEYTFSKDNTFSENGYSERMTYSLNGDTLTLYWDEDTKSTLKYVTKSDNINWKEDEFFYDTVFWELGEYEGFFYETEYKSDEWGISNVMWMRRKQKN